MSDITAASNRRPPLNMTAWLRSQRDATVKRSMPVLSFPSISLLGISVEELISNPDRQARGMKAVADRCPDMLAAVSMMDLSVEAEAFGSTIRVSGDEVPTVVGRIIETPEDAQALKVPSVDAGRTGRYVQAIAQAAALITDRPVFAGVIGPFSLAGRLMDMTEIMINCYENPEMVEATIGKTAAFLEAYIKEYKKIGANGVVMAEPAAGLLSPDLAEAFSTKFIKRIAAEVKDDNFAFIYHNCGNTIPLLGSILTIQADAYHFGNMIDIGKVLEAVPPDTLVMGNIDPVSVLRNGTPETARAAVLDLLGRCAKHPNWIISSGCDIPPLTPWANIDAYFSAIREFYGA